MHSHDAGTLAFRTKYSLSPPNDQPLCCHLPCYYLLVRHCFFSGYLYSPFPPKTLLLVGRRKLRPFCDSRDSDIMRLLADQEEILPDEVGSIWKKGRREVEIEWIDGERRGSRMEGKARRSSSRKNNLSDSVRNTKLDEVGRRRPLVGYGNSKKASRYDRVDVVEEEVWEVDKYADNIWQKSGHCSNSNKKDLALNARNKEPTGRNSTLIRLGVMDAEQKVDQRTNLAKRVNINESGSDGRLKKATRMYEVQLDDVKQPSVSACARKVVQGESLAYAARRSCDMDLRVDGNEVHRRSVDQQSKSGHISYNGVRNDVHPRRDFEEISITGRGDRSYLKQNSASKSQDKIVYLDKQTVEQDESRKGTRKIGEVSLFHGGGFEKASHFDDERVMRRDHSINLIQDSSPVSRSKRSLMELQLSIENKSEEREAKLPMAGSSVQLTEDRKQLIDSKAIEHDKVIRNTHMLSRASEVHCGNMETLLLSGDNIGIDLRPHFAQNSRPSTKDKGTQVETHEAYHHIELSKLNAKNSSTSSRISPKSQVDPLEYDTFLSMKHFSSMREQNSQANRQDNLLHTASMESQGDTNELNLTSSSNKIISNFQGTCSSRIENEEEFASTKISSVALTRTEDISKTSITGEKSLSASMEATSTGSLHNISRSQQTYSGLNNDVNKIQLDINDSANKFDKSLVSHVGKFDGAPQEMIVPTSIKETALYSGIQMGKPDRRDVQTTLSSENNKVTLEKSSFTQESKERHSSLFMGESSQWNTVDVTSTGNLGNFSCSVKAHNEADSHNGRVDIHNFTSDATEHAQQLAKSSVFQVGELVDNKQQEIMSLNESRNETTIYNEFQFEEMGLRQATTDMQVGELTGNRRDQDVKHMNVGGRQSLSGLGMRGPSDEIWHVQGVFSQETSSAAEHKDDSLASGTMNATIPTHLEMTDTRRSPKSLWSYVADIIRMSWILRGHSHSSTLKSDKRSSSNDSLSSEVWFSGPDSEVDKITEEFEYTSKIGLLKESEPVKEPVKLFLEESKNVDRLTMMEPNSSNTSLVGEEQMQDLKSIQGTLSSISVVEQRLGSASDTALISISDIVEPNIRDKSKVLKPSSSYPIAARRKVFASSITQARSVENMEAALVEGNNSCLEFLEQPAVSVADSALLRITDIEEVDNPESIPKLELDAFREKPLQFGGNYESGIKQRKFQRNMQLPSEQFDKWEKAFKRENEQKKVDEYFMREAILEAKKGADTWEVAVGAVLVQNGKIIARSCNMVEEMRDSTAHAEMICIREASNLLRTWNLTETTLYVTLEPCPMCAGAILQARIDTVVWGAPNRLLGADGSWVRLFPGDDEGSSSSLNPPGHIVGPVHPLHPKIKIRRGVLETECGDVMHQFFKLRRKKDKKPESSPPPSCLPISNRPTKIFSRLHNFFCMMFCL